MIGIPLTKSGRQRKAGRLLGDLVDSALIVGAQATSQPASNTEIAASATASPWVSVMLANQFSHYELVDYKNGAKTLVQFYPSTNQTSVFHDIPSIDECKRQPFSPDVTVDGEIDKGKHIFGFHDSVTFKGWPPNEIPSDTSWWLTHKIGSSNDWHFPPNCKLSIDADGNRFQVNVFRQFELSRDSASDAELTETLIAVPTFQVYKAIANANLVIIQIGSASFTLDAEVIASYRNFVGYLTPTSRKR